MDVYRGQQKPIRNVADYALFISFFPQLVAGPIVRAWQFFRDLYDWRAPNSAEVQRGTLLVILGLTKKLALADQFALVSDAYFADVLAKPGMLTAWTGTAAFALQVYFDFSGYSDMAIGMAQLFGFHFPENFRRPFLATCVTDLWRRWHMTLTSWLRDYVYIPLGGNRRGSLRTYLNLTITMALAGLWHGAAWHFVVWGGTQGVLMSAERVAGIQPIGFRGRPFAYAMRMALTFGVWVAFLAIFRAPGLKEAWFALQQMFAGARGESLLTPWHFGLAGCALVLAILEEWREWFERLVRGPVWAYGAVLAMLLAALEMFSMTERSVPFFYFQF
ncbi:MAG TPA: MBOAT family O-acyltransferase [Bryobacteraceae bacterium]|nr:MBOAT family O-acyltransferase [Bryobacteraceae bacterium]